MVQPKHWLPPDNDAVFTALIFKSQRNPIKGLGVAEEKSKQKSNKSDTITKVLSSTKYDLRRHDTIA